MKRLAVIADDLTGANENGLHFINNKLKAQTLIYQKAEFQGDLRKIRSSGGILIVDSESRQSAPAEAAAKTVKIAGLLYSAGIEKIYLKFDSTLRGNIGSSLGAVLALRKNEYAAVCMAFPAAGRTTKNGEQYVGNRKVSASAFAKDPLNPVSSSNIRKVLREGTKLSSALIALRTLRAGARIAKNEKERLLSKGARIIVFDCVTDGDLKLVAEVIEDCKVICGASALSKELAGKGKALPQAAVSTGRRVVGIAGSLNPVTAEQIKYLTERERFRQVFVGAEDAVLRSITADLGKKDFMIVLRDDETTKAYIRRLIEEKGRTEAVELISRGLAGIAGQCGADTERDAFFFTGGATAAGACIEFGLRGFKVAGAAGIGIPLLCSEPGNTPVVTKSGGFGKKDAFLSIIKCLKGGKPCRRQRK